MEIDPIRCICGLESCLQCSAAEKVPNLNPVVSCSQSLPEASTSEVQAIAVATWNVHHLGEITATNLALLEKKESTLSAPQRKTRQRTQEKLNICQECLNLFTWNPWLDALVLQEVRNGINYLEKVINAQNQSQDEQLTLLKGPKMASSGGDSSGQNEYYPIIFRSRRIESCTYWGAVTTSGEVDSGKNLVWDKSKLTYRPTVVYELTLRDRTDCIRVGVVHTTPGNARTAETKKTAAASDNELQREDQYGQVKKLFEKIAAGNQELCTSKSGEPVHWIIGGDYYIGSEALIQCPSFSLGKRGAPFDNIANHDVFRDNTLDSRIDQALTQQSITKLDFDSLVEEIKDRRGFVGTDLKRIDGLEERFGAMKSAVKDQILRMLKLKLWSSLVRENMTVKASLVTNTGITTLRHEAALSFKKNIPKGLAILQTTSGTNWHDNTLKSAIPNQDLARAKYFRIARVADFFVVTETFKLKDKATDSHLSQVGLMAQGGGLLLADTEDLSCSKYWNQHSDHFPVACYLALEDQAAALTQSVIRIPERFVDQVVLACERDHLMEDISVHWLQRLVTFLQEWEFEQLEPVRTKLSAWQEQVKWEVPDLSASEIRVPLHIESSELRKFIEDSWRQLREIIQSSSETDSPKFYYELLDLCDCFTYWKEIPIADFGDLSLTYNGSLPPVSLGEIKHKRKILEVDEKEEAQTKKAKFTQPLPHAAEPIKDGKQEVPPLPPFN